MSLLLSFHVLSSKEKTHLKFCCSIQQHGRAVELVFPFSMIPIKLSAFHSPPAISIINYGGSGSNCRFGYFFGEYVNNIIQYGKLNCTVIEGSRIEGYGLLNQQTGLYNGIIGLVQRNITEMIAMITRVPTAKDDFKYGPIAEPSWVTFASTYKPHSSNTYEILDVTYSLLSVTRRVWVMSFVLVIVFWFLFAFGKLFLRKKRKRFHQRSYWTIITFVFSESTINVRGVFFCMTALLLSLFVYWFQMFMENFMTTNFIQPKAVQMIDSFEEIMNLRFHPEHGYVEPDSAAGQSDKSRPLKPYFIRQARTSGNFKLAPPELIQRKIYDYTERVADGKNFLIDMRTFFNDPGTFLSMDYFIVIEVVEILNVFRQKVCSVIAAERKHQPNSAIAVKSVRFAKKEEVPFFLGHLYSESISDYKRQHLDRQLRRQFEVGLNYKSIAAIYRSKSPPKSSIRDCFNDEVHVPIPNIDSLELRCFKGAVYHLFYFLLASFFLLLIELARFRYSRRARPHT